MLWWHKYCIWQQLNGNTFFSQVLPLLSNYSEVIDWSCYPQPPSSHTPTNKTLQQLFFKTFVDCCPFKQIKQGQLQLYNTQKNLPAVIVLTIFPKAIAIFIKKWVFLFVNFFRRLRYLIQNYANSFNDNPQRSTFLKLTTLKLSYSTVQLWVQLKSKITTNHSWSSSIWTFYDALYIWWMHIWLTIHKWPWSVGAGKVVRASSFGNSNGFTPPSLKMHVSMLDVFLPSSNCLIIIHFYQHCC